MDNQLVLHADNHDVLRRPPFSTAATKIRDGPFFHGNILGARASSRALYNELFPPPVRLETKDDTALLLVFDRGEGDEVRDRSGKNPPAKIHGATWVGL